MKRSMQQNEKNENTETNSTKHLVYTTKLKKNQRRVMLKKNILGL